MSTRFAGQAVIDTGLAGLLEQNNSSFNPGLISGQGIEGRSTENMAVTKGDAQVNMYGLKGMADVASAGYAAEATRAEGQAAGQTAMAEGFGSMISGFAGGISPSTFGGDAGGGGYTTPGGIETGMPKEWLQPTQLGVNHFQYG